MHPWQGLIHDFLVWAMDLFHSLLLGGGGMDPKEDRDLEELRPPGRRARTGLARRLPPPRWLDAVDHEAGPDCICSTPQSHQESASAHAAVDFSKHAPPYWVVETPLMEKKSPTSSRPPPTCTSGTAELAIKLPSAANREAVDLVDHMLWLLAS